MISILTFLIAANVTLSWQASSSPYVNYRVYVGATSGNYTETFDAGNSLMLSLQNLTPNLNYYFVVTAYDSTEESDFSSEASFVAPMPGLSLEIHPSTLLLKSFSNATFVIESSTNLQTWAPFQTVFSSSDLTSIPITENLPVQFFRAKWISSERVPLAIFVATPAERAKSLTVSLQTKPKSFWKKLRLLLKYKPNMHPNLQKLMPSRLK